MNRLNFLHLLLNYRFTLGLDEFDLENRNSMNDHKKMSYVIHPTVFHFYATLKNGFIDKYVACKM